MKKLLAPKLTLVLATVAFAGFAAPANAAFSITMTSADTTPGSASANSVGNSGAIATSPNLNAPGGGVIQATLNVANSTGSLFDLTSLTVIRTAGTGGPVTVTVTLRSDTISYADGLATYTAVAPDVSSAPASGTINSITHRTGNVSGPVLGTISGAAGTTSFISGPETPRFIEIEYNLSFGPGTGSAQVFTFLDVTSTSYLDNVTVATPAPFTALAALSALPLIGGLRLARRRAVARA